MEAAIDITGLQHAILTCVTAGPGLGFNRAALFLADDEASRLVAALVIGPATPEEAHVTWTRLASEQRSLDDLLHGVPKEKPSGGLQALFEGLSIPLTSPTVNGGGERDAGAAAAAESNPLLEAYRMRQVVKIVDAAALASLPGRLREIFAGTEVVCVPLVAKNRSIGLIVADNAFTHEPITEERIQLLKLLALLAGLAVDNARIYAQVERQARELQATLDALKRTQEKLLHGERLAAIGSVVARVSHEIRNPLATIGGFASMLTAKPTDALRVERNAAIIAAEVEKLEALLKEMLDFTSPRPPALASVDLNAMIASLVEVHRGELAARDVALHLELAHDLAAVRADVGQMQQVCLNLWRNALESLEETPAGRARALTIRTAHEGPMVTVTFTDTGSGITPEAMPHLFTPFFTTKRRGTGLGLAVVKKIVDDHHGEIHVRDEGQPGVSFVIGLPAAR